MTSDVENLVLEHLRAIRADISRIKNTLEDQTLRISSLEQKVAFIAVDIARIDGRLDGFEKRLGRIETRLNLVEA